LPRSSIYSTRKAAPNGTLGKTVAVIASWADLLRAKRIPSAADFFELRLDALAPIIDQVELAIQSLKAPVIITARHPREGGANNLDAAHRAALLLRFLSRAAYIDIELRALRELASVHRQAHRKKIGVIVSVHYLKETPSLTLLRRKANRAVEARADIFKIAMRTDTAKQLERLLDFFDEQHVDLPMSAMGIGRFGRAARLELARRGSVLNYVHLVQAQVAGQLSISEWKKFLPRLHRPRR
jgi:3-dehydroquinate dehydratase-1